MTAPTPDEAARLFKAVRPDYTTRNGVTWRVGETTTHPTSTAMVVGDPGTYLSVSTEPAETLIGGSIPARLLAVEPAGEVISCPDLRHKRCGLAFRVLAELPAWQVLGPNGRQVVALIERARVMTGDERNRVAAAWDAAWAADRDAARAADRDAARAAAGAAAGDAAWAAAGAAAGDAAWAAAGAAAGDAAWDAAWAAAGDAAWDAAWAADRDAAGALVVRDLITPEQYDLLAGPLLSVIGPVEDLPVPDWCAWGTGETCDV